MSATLAPSETNCDIENQRGFAGNRPGNASYRVGNHIALQLGQGGIGARQRSNIMFTILLIILVLALIGGGLGHSRYGYAGWSPAGILVVILLFMLFTGHRV